MSLKGGSRCSAGEYEPVSNESALKLLYTLRHEIKSVLTSVLRKIFVNKVGNECILSGQIEFGTIIKGKY